MKKEAENKCANCALCSFVCINNTIECDVDNHVINNEHEEGCKENFIAIEE